MQRETKYAYSVARIRVAENYLLNKAKYETMLEASSISDALRVLYEANYLEDSDYEIVLKTESQKLFNYLKEISPDIDVFKMFLFKSDCHNMKVLLKDEFSGKDSYNILLDNGVFSIAKLKVMIQERDFRLLPIEIKEGIDEVYDVFGRTKNPQVIDLIIDKAYYMLYQRLSQDTKSKYLIDVSKIMIDFANLNTYIRIKNKMDELDLLINILLDGGSIKKDFYTTAFGDDINSFLEKIKQSKYSEVFEAAIENNNVVITKFEKACDDYLMGYIKKSKYKAFGIEPLIGYMYAKETEMKNVRIILVGKINNIDSDVIRERLRASYV